MKNNTWNKLLELKKLPFGSVHCIKDQDLEQEVSDIIVDVLQNDCMNDDEIHDENHLQSSYRFRKIPRPSLFKRNHRSF